MYRTVSLGLSISMVAGWASAQSCTIEDFYVPLNSEILSRLQFNPSGELFKYVDFQSLAIDFGEIDKYDVPINAQGDTLETELLPVEITLTAGLKSFRETFLNLIRQNVRLDGGNDSVAVQGGFMRVLSSSLVRSMANVTYTKRTGGDIKIELGEASTPITLDITANVSPDRLDMKFDGSVDVGDADVDSWFGDLLDIATFPITIGGEVFNFDSVGDAFNGFIEDEFISDKIDEARQGAVSSVGEIFKGDTINGLIVEGAVRFLIVFEQELRYANDAGFSGENPPDIDYGFFSFPAQQDTQTVLRLHKETDLEDYATYITPGTACAMISDLKMVRLLGDEVTGSSQAEHLVVSGDTLEGLANERYGRPELAMAIAQENGISDPNMIFVGQTLRFPMVTSLVSPETYVVRSGDTIWDISKIYEGGSDGVEPMIERSVLPFGANLIYPGMTLPLRPHE